MADDASLIAPPTSARRLPIGPAVWIVAVVAVVGAVLVHGATWGLRHPLPTTWDEATYDVVLNHDLARWTHRGPRRFVAGLVYDDLGRPPAYRLLVLPWVLVARAVRFDHLRVLAVGWLTVTAVGIAATVYRLTRCAPAAALAAALACLSAKAFASTAHFGTEYALYLGTVLMFAGLLLDWDQPRPRRLGWAVLAAGLAVSALAKPSVAVMVTVPLATTAVLARAGAIRGPSPAYLAKAIAAAVVVAGPWWAVGWRMAIVLARTGVTFERRTFGTPGPSAWARYLAELYRYEVGLPVAVLATALLARAGWQAVRRVRPSEWPAGAASASAVDWAILTLVLPALVTIGVQMLSTNHDGRLVSHAHVVLAIAAGLAAARVGALKRPAGRAVALAAVIIQAVLLAGPQSVIAAVSDRLPLLAVGHDVILRDWQQWDWRPLRTACDARGLSLPRIALLGRGGCFNRPQVQLPWAPDDRTPTADHLWQWEQRRFDMGRVLADAQEYDVVLTVPGLVGSAMEHQERDNAYNGVFAARLAADPAFGPPVTMTIGSPTPVTVDVFFRRRPDRP